MQKKHILIIGKSPTALESMMGLLRKRGYEVETTDVFDDIAGRFDLRQLDLITTGGQVPVGKREEIRHDARELNHDMLFVQGLAGIPGLVVQQIEGEFAAQYRDTVHTPIFDAATRGIKFLLEESASVKITCWWQTSFVPPNPGSDSLVLVDETMSADGHTILIPPAIPPEASFVTVRIGKAIYCFGLA
jgi:hypothetical protein